MSLLLEERPFITSSRFPAGVRFLPDSDLVRRKPLLRSLPESTEPPEKKAPPTAAAALPPLAAAAATADRAACHPCPA